MLPIEDIIQTSQNFTLNTERLSMRRFRSTDLAEEIKQQQDPEVVRYIREPMSNEEVVNFFEQFIKPFEATEQEWLGICVELSGTGENIGAISFRIESIELGIFEIGYRLNPKYQGKGYATEAMRALVGFVFDHCKAHKVVAYCDPENIASYRVMEKLSMCREGQLREHFKIGQSWRDAYVYGVLEREWQA